MTVEQRQRYEAELRLRAEAGTQPPATRPARASRPDCPERGEFLRVVECPTCKGCVMVKVFACAKHGECTLGKAVDGVHLCGG